MLDTNIGFLKNMFWEIVDFFYFKNFDLAITFKVMIKMNRRKLHQNCSIFAPHQL